VKLPFVIWMLGFPLVDELCHYLLFLQGQRRTEFSYMGEMAFIYLAFYVIIAVMIWNKKEVKEGK
jgi:hypothetical protein